MQPSVGLQCVTNTEKAIYKRDEVAQHSQDGDIWIIIENDVYDLSAFLHEHPGGPEGGPFKFPARYEAGLSSNISTVLLGTAGRDATKKFRKYHRVAILNPYKDRLLLGKLEQSHGNERSLRSSIISMFRRSRES